MKRALIFAALLALLSPLAHHTAQASSASITLAPGVTLNLGDRDRRGYYWDGGRWREPRWWNDRYSYNERRWWRHEEWRRQQQWERERRWHERDVSVAGNISTAAIVIVAGIVMTIAVQTITDTIAINKKRPAEPGRFRQHKDFNQCDSGRNA